MRIRTWKSVSLVVVASNMIVLFYMLYRLDPKCKCQGGSMGSSEFLQQMINTENIDEQFAMDYLSHADIKMDILHSNLTKPKNIADIVDKVQRLITIIIREFEDFENDVKRTVNSILHILPNVSVLIVSDSMPYPPLDLELKLLNVKILNLKPLPDQSYAFRPENWFTTKYVMLVPDSCRFTSINQVLKMMTKLNIRKDADIIAAKVIGGKPKYSNVEVDLKKWTLSYGPVKSTADLSDVLEGSHVVMMHTEKFIKASHPWSKPFPDTLFIQTAYRKNKILCLEDMVFEPGETLFLERHNRLKRDRLYQQRLQQFYFDYGIKKVTTKSGDVQLYGCTKESERCFGTVVDDTPDYLFQNRWTPPCCLEHLRETSRYVFKILDKCHTRYWLEGGSLLGAVRYEDIIPWDYDVDIGIYKEDIAKCSWLKNAEKQSIVDAEGFLWEKATEGDFFRVQFSKTNHLHVDIFPFYSRDGVMTKDTWFMTHKQDTEFPEHFLRPLGHIKFIGMYVTAPNNIREFIELKFGKGAIERPEYPAPHKLSLNITADKK